VILIPWDWKIRNGPAMLASLERGARLDGKVVIAL
jgi:hypothetical protein